MDKTIEIDDPLVKAAQDATGETDERAAVETAVKCFVSGKVAATGGARTDSLSAHAGQFEFAESYDVLKERGARGLPG
jgi:Arc/MetJ family transcription regulator